MPVKRFKRIFNFNYVTDFSHLRIINNKVTVLINKVYYVRKEKIYIKGVKSVLLKYDKTYDYVIKLLKKGRLLRTFYVLIYENVNEPERFINLYDIIKSLPFYV